MNAYDPVENTLTLPSGLKLNGVHTADECLLGNCCIHNPSDHPLRDAPLDAMMLDTGVAMTRVCSHGYSHPDPDDIAFMRATGRFLDVEAICSVHLVRENCDGCCQRKHDAYWDDVRRDMDDPEYARAYREEMEALKNAD